MNTRATLDVLGDVFAERIRQHSKWGEQSHPDGTSAAAFVATRDAAQKLCDAAFKAGKGTWRHILAEEVAEAFAEEDVTKLRAELVQCAAVCSSWIEAIDRRGVVK